MSHSFEVLETRVGRLERQNRLLKYLALVLLALAAATAVFGQRDKDVTLQGQKFELRDGTGRVRAELAILNGEPVLSFYDEHGDNESFVDGSQFTILKKGGGDSDIQAMFAADGLSFEGDYNRQFVSLRADRGQQTGKLQLNDYGHKVYAAISPGDLLKLLRKKAE